MQWQDIRTRLPNEWLLVEAIKAHSREGKRIVEDLAVMDVFPDSGVAMNEYAKLHRRFPDREMYVLHTSRPELNIEERYWLGVRPAQ